jgi:hypothetical protein
MFVQTRAEMEEEQMKRYNWCVCACVHARSGAESHAMSDTHTHYSTHYHNTHTTHLHHRDPVHTPTKP